MEKTARLITANEVAVIVGNKTWASTNKESLYFNRALYSWLVGNDGAYWTSSPYPDKDSGWAVSSDSVFNDYTFREFGVRPVITVSKSKFN